MDHLVDSSDILEQWIIPDEEFEQCFKLDDLDCWRESCSDFLGFSNQPQLACTSDSGISKNSDTISPSVTMEIRDDQTMVTTSSGNVGSATHESTGKRRCREKIIEAPGDHSDGVAPGTHPKHSMNGGGQARQLGKRLSSSDISTRYTIRTKTDVDVIDDCYRWRKYGQKPVKNSDHPRSYYRCTTPNCLVRKQVERCNQNPANLLTTYYGKHNHPKSPSPVTEALSEGPVEDLHSSSPTRTQDGHFGPPTGLPPSNYMSQTLLDHMISGALLDRPGWPHVPSPVSQTNLNLLRAQQLFMLQCQTQYPFLPDMLTLMQNYHVAQSPFFDPSFAFLAAQNYGMRLRAQASADRSAATPVSVPPQQASRSAPPMSSSQHRLLRMQKLMGEKWYASDAH